MKMLIQENPSPYCGEKRIFFLSREEIVELLKVGYLEGQSGPYEIIFYRVTPREAGKIERELCGS